MDTALTAATKRHIAPIVQFNSEALFRGGTHSDVIDQGTITFVSWNSRIFGITNQHVLSAQRRHQSSVLAVALDEWRPIPAKLLYVGGPDCTRYPFDLVILEWNQDHDLARFGKEPVPLLATPNLPAPEELVLAVGYPGVQRKPVNEVTIEHGLYHIGIYAGSAGDDNLSLRLNQSGLDPTTRFGGISGGPVLRVIEAEYTLSGIIYEGLGPAELTGSIFGAEVILGAAVPIWGERLDELIACGCH